MPKIIRLLSKAVTYFLMDALLTQRSIASYIVGRKGYYHFTVKGNQPTLLQDIKLYFKDRKEPDFATHDLPDHGRLETRNLDHLRTERLSQLPPCGTGLRDRTTLGRQEDRQRVP